MKKLIIVLLILNTINLISAKDSYLIKSKIDNCPDLKNAYLYEYSYGNYNLIDTAIIKAGSFQFYFDRKNHPGIYKIRLSPDKVIENILFNFEDIELSADYEKIKQTINFTKSKENKLLHEYISYTENEKNREKALYYLLALYNTEDILFAQIIEELERLKKYNREVIQGLIKENNTFLAAKYIQYEQFPFDSIHDNINQQREYLTEHFWDNIDFLDNSLLYFPFYSTKIDDYFTLFEHSGIDREEQERLFRIPADIIFQKTAVNEKVFEYTLDKILHDVDVFNLYDLYRYIAENYAKAAFCINVERMAEIDKKVSKIGSVSIGSPAPDFKIAEQLNLNDIKKEFTLIIFWDSACPYCYRTLNELKPVYEHLKSDKLEIVAVSLDTNARVFKKTILERGYNWINICDFKGWNSEIADSYNISAIPSMFLLDKFKRIISRPVSVKQLKYKLQIPK
ncbi:thioredoxin-like domain-containing protein [Bacteroidota bacterium]